MSDGSNYALRWQTPVGWLSDHIPDGERSDSPDIEVVRKLAYHMQQARKLDYTDTRSTPNDVPTNRVYHFDGCRGMHICEFEGCNGMMHGVFGLNHWKFPYGIIHYMVVHHWQPPVEFLADVAKLPDPPEEFTVNLSQL